MSYYLEAINEILKFKDNFDRMDHRVSTKLLPVLGEFYVLNELEKQGFNNIEHRGFQSNFDILVDSRKSDDKKRIEVKTSRLKSDDKKFMDMSYYGWVVEKKNQKKIDKFDILICVALDNSFNSPRFFILTRNEAFSVEDANNRRYPSLQKRIILFNDQEKIRKDLELNHNLLKGSNYDINMNQLNFCDRWDII